MLTHVAGAPGLHNFALIFNRNTSTSAAWSEQNRVIRNIATHSGKLCRKQLWESQSQQGSWYKSYAWLHIGDPGKYFKGFSAYLTKWTGLYVYVRPLPWAQMKLKRSIWRELTWAWCEVGIPSSSPSTPRKNKHFTVCIVGRFYFKGRFKKKKNFFWVQRWVLILTWLIETGPL